MSATPRSWGGGRWGSTPWGGAGALALALASATAVRENVVQLVFNRRVYFSTLGDVDDASLASHYTVTPVAGTTGADGLHARAVSVAAVALAAETDDGASFASDDLPGGTRPGQVVNVTLDRPMSPYPAAYVLAVQGLWTYDLSQALPPTSTDVAAVYRAIVAPQNHSPHPSRDFANPQSLAALGAAGAAGHLSPGAQLGTLVTDDSGDYAVEWGRASLKKRLFRRYATPPGAFVHLPNYGVGLLAEGKKLARASEIGRLSAACEAQAALEPEVVAAKVRITCTTTGIARVTTVVKTRGGDVQRVDMDLPTT